MVILKLFQFGRKKTADEDFESEVAANQLPHDDDHLAIEKKNAKDIQVIKMVCFLTLFLVFTNYRTLKDVNENHRTVVQFGSNQAEYWVSGTDVGTDYARTMAVYLMSMWGNVTSASAKSQFAEILKYAHPYYLSSLQTRLNERRKLLEKYKTLALYARLTPDDIMTKNRLTEHPYSMIKGAVYRVTYKIQQRRMLASDAAPEKAVEMTFDFTVENGTAYLLDIFESKAGKL